MKMGFKSIPFFPVCELSIHKPVLLAYGFKSFFWDLSAHAPHWIPSLREDDSHSSISISTGQE